MNSSPFTFESFLSGSCKAIRSSFLREILDIAGMSGIISFAGGLPNPDLFPVSQIRIALDQVMSDGGKSTLQYSGSQGYLPLREWIAGRYYKRFGIKVAPDNILITNGSQQALDLAGKLFLDPGDCILMEKPSYIGAIQAFSAYDIKMEQISLEHDGISITELKEKCRRCNPKFLYGIPNYQNPSGISYSEGKRLLLAEWLRTKKLPFIEDDPYSEIYFTKTNGIPVSFLLPEQCILTGSFSKMISPGIRTGWMLVPDKLKSYLLKAKQAADLHTNNIVQQLIYRFLVDNDVDMHLDRIRIHYHQQKETMLMLARHFLPQRTRFTNPDGGMFIWATLPDEFDTTELVKYAISEKVIFVPGKTFYVNGEGNHSMRLNFTSSSPDEMEDGMKRLRQAINLYMEHMKVKV
ncbi:MAG: PLP-dependent aminotransferase family protein [Bacteroidales bacterium]|nr:PLP-dependent aminotransferase family protein [Bacteroidales bacterium]